MHVRPLNLSDSSDFADYCRAMSALYGELFGKNAAPSVAPFLIKFGSTVRALRSGTEALRHSLKLMKTNSTLQLSTHHEGQ